MSEKYNKILSGVVATLAAASISMSSLSLMSCSGKSNNSQGGSTTSTDSQGITDIVGDDYTQPNIVFILLDDTGVTDFGCYGNDFNETPNIDKVASEGTRFTSYYTQPVCSPSRSCAMTGMGTVRTGITNFLDNNNSVYLDSEEFTLLPQMLNDAGYHTGMIGKWHLCAGYENYPTKGNPYDAGFDEVILSEQRYIGGGDYFYPYYHLPQVTDGKNGDYLIDVMNDAAVDYIKKSAESEEPFFLYLSHYATHTTLDAPSDTLKYFQKKRGTNGDKGTQDRNPYLAAMLKHIDEGVGAIDQTLTELGIRENTLLVIASDNGGSLEFTDNDHYRGGKSQLYEGGLKDPLIISWPKASPEARVTDFPVSVIDLYQTFGEAAGIEPDKVPENSGVSLWSLVTGAGQPERDTLYWAFLRQSGTTEDTVVNYNTPSGGGIAIRVGDYKYIECLEYYRRELYNVADDPGETKNIIEDNLELADSMAKKLYSLLAADTVGKSFSAAFDNNEYYRWAKSGSMNKSGGRFTSAATDLAAVTREDLLTFSSDISADVTVGPTGSAGILFRSALATPSKTAFTAYGAALDAENGKVSLVNLKNSGVYPIASADLTLEANKAYRMRVVADGYEIKIYVGDTLALTCNDETYIHGGVGFFSDHCKASFDNLTYKGIESSKEFTDLQVNSKPWSNEYNVSVDYHWLRSGASAIDGTIYVNAAEFLTLLGAEHSIGADSLTLKLRGVSSSFTKNSDSATVGGKSVTLAAPMIEKEGKLLLPIEAFTGAVGLVCEINGKLITVKSSEFETVSYTNPRIKYTGAWSDLGMTNRAPGKDASAELAFEGCGVRLYLDRGNLACIFEVYIDGELVATVDAYNPTALSRSLMFETYGLPYGTHTIKVVNTGTCRAGGGGTNLNITAFEIVKTATGNGGSGGTDGSGSDTPSVSAVQIPMTDESITYVGSWSVAGATKRSKLANEYCEYTFEGTGIDVYMGVGNGAGIFEVWIDGELVETVDGYQPSPETVLKFSTDSLSKGTHTVKLVNTGTKNASGTATNMNLAYFIIYS